jgi:hypothetical protein
MSLEHGANPPRVFATYSHDTPEHKDQVRKFCTFLRTEAGIDVHLDQWDDDGRRDWSVWALEQIHEADFILALASPDFKRRADGLAPPDVGRGAQFEGRMLRDQMTGDGPEAIRRILPVVLPGQSIENIPSFLAPYAATHYIITEFTLTGCEELLAAISRVAKHPKPNRGTFRGNPYAELHATLQAEEQARPAPAPTPPASVNHGVVFKGPVDHTGDIYTGGQTIYRDGRS